MRRIHDIGLVHRDIKLDNILLQSPDSGRCGKLVLIDFGLSSLYLDPNSNHIEKEEEDAFVGNHIFASRRAMLLESNIKPSFKITFLFYRSQ